MLRWDQNALEYAEEALADLRRNMGVQVAGEVGLGVLYAFLVGWTVVLTWFAASLAARAANVILGPVAERWLGSRRLAVQVRLVLASMMCLVVTMLAVVAAWRMGAWGVVVGAQVLTGMVIYSGQAARKSLHAYLAFVGPPMLQMATLWVVAYAHQPSTAVVACMVGNTLATMGMSVNLWRGAAATAIAETSARQAAEAATEAKSSFVAMVSHELRTPISGILAGSEEIKRTATQTSVGNHAGLIADSGRMMRRLLDDLLDISKIEAGRMTVEQIDFDLRRLVADIARFWAPEARRQGLRFRLEGARAMPRWVKGDPTRVRQILNNLLSNALKFTEAGSVTLRLVAAVRRDGQIGVTLEIVDTGHGMSADQTGRLFQAFDQLSASTARTHGGTGLGLNISRRLAQLMHGDLTATSVEGEGSVFRLTVLMASGQDPVEEAALVDDPDPPVGVRALIVDDHAVNRKAFDLILQSVCEEIVCVEDGDTALKLLAQRSFDVILMDLNMPRLGGLEATRRLRAAAGPNQHAPVIALTASVSPKETEVCLAAGMTSFILKPVEAGELIRAVAEVLAAEPADGSVAAA